MLGRAYNISVLVPQPRSDKVLSFFKLNTKALIVLPVCVLVFFFGLLFGENIHSLVVEWTLIPCEIEDIECNSLPRSGRVNNKVKPESISFGISVYFHQQIVLNLIYKIN